MDLGRHSREEIEDITGAVPLLPDVSIVKGRINLPSSVLLNVGVHVEETSNAILDRRGDVG